MNERQWDTLKREMKWKLRLAWEAVRKCECSMCRNCLTNYGHSALLPVGSGQRRSGQNWNNAQTPLPTEEQQEYCRRQWCETDLNWKGSLGRVLTGLGAGYELSPEASEFGDLPLVGVTGASTAAPNEQRPKELNYEKVSFVLPNGPDASIRL